MARFKSLMPNLLRKQRKAKPPSDNFDDDEEVFSDGEDDPRDRRARDREEPLSRRTTTRKPANAPGPSRQKFDIHQLQEELDLREHEIKSLLQEKNELRKHLDELEHQLDIAHAEGQKQADRLKEEIDRHAQTRQLVRSGSRSGDGGGGQAAWSAPVDLVTTADVIAMVEELNRGVLQVASYIADGYTFEKVDDAERPTDEIREARSESSRILGRKFIDMIRSTEHAGAPALVQIALQASIHSCCRRIVAARHFDRNRYGSLLTEICRGISDDEEQVVSGKWRSLTHTHFQRVLASWRRQPEEDFIPDIASYIADILLVAGVRQRRREILKSLDTTHHDRLAAVKKTILQINKAVVEEFTSGDIEAIYHHPRTEFDPATMDDANAVAAEESGGAGAHAEEILCTTDMGLRMYERLPPEKKHGEPEWTRAILLKAKVVLHDGVSRIRESSERERRSMHPVPPPRKVPDRRVSGVSVHDHDHDDHDDHDGD